MVEEYTQLQTLHTFGVPWQSRFFCTVEDLEQAQRVVNYSRSNRVPMFILGGGSNILPTGTYEGLVIKNEIAGRVIVDEDETTLTLEVGAGESWHDLVLWTVEHGYYGLENLALIPGTVGGAVVQNIGAYDVDLGRFIQSVEAINLETGETGCFKQHECQFEYRNSIFKSKRGVWMVTRVVLSLSKQFNPVLTYRVLAEECENHPHPTAKEIMQMVIAIRTSKLPDPNEIGTAGSFFANPRLDQQSVTKLLVDYPDMPVFDNYGSGEHTIPAGWLIEQADIDPEMKDKFLYPKHHLVVVNNNKNTDGTSGSEIAAFTTLVQKQVQEKFGIELIPEVVVL